VTVASWDGVRLSADSFSRAGVTVPTYAQPTVRTRVGDVSALIATDGRTRLTGSMQRLRGSKWVPLRNAKGWLRGRGEDVSELRRTFRTDKKGTFSLSVQVREDIISGYVPQRSWMVGVTGTRRLKPSSSNWIETREAPVPTARKSRGSAQSLPANEVRVRG
jgi:hypothetical protein